MSLAKMIENEAKRKGVSAAEVLRSASKELAAAHTLHFRADAELLADLDKEAAERGITRSAVVAERCRRAPKHARNKG